MAITLKVITVGNSVGVVLPRELLEKLRVGKGDLLQVRDVPGGVALTPYDADFAQQLDVAERVAREDRDVLKHLGDESLRKEGATDEQDEHR
jgi:putative addiction module antidote